MDQIFVRVPEEDSTQREVRSTCGELLATKCFAPVPPHALILSLVGFLEKEEK